MGELHDSWFVLLAAVLLVPAASNAIGSERVGEVWIDPSLDEILEAHPDGATVLIGLSSPAGSAVQEHLVEHGFEPLVFEHVPVVAVRAVEADLDTLMSTPGAVSLAPDAPVETMQIPSAEASNWAATGDAITRADAARALGVDGSGVGVAVVDTGVNGPTPHPGLFPDELGGPLVQNVKTLVGRDPVLPFASSPANLFLENQTGTDGTGGHGTHVAGIVAGQPTDDDRFRGRAPGADLIGLSTGEGLSIIWAIAAYDWILEHQDAYGIRIATNSYGVDGPYQPLDPLNLATKAAVDAGIVVIFSAGNDGPEQRTMNAFAQAPHVVAVGATTPGGAIAGFSSRGDPTGVRAGPDLVAPGFNVISARSAPVSGMDVSQRALTYDAHAIPGEDLPFYRTLSGTSMAAPQVAGIVALVLDADPTLTVSEVRGILNATARPLVGYEFASQGHGLVDAEAAVLAALGQDPGERTWVRPLVREQVGEVHRYPFHGGGPGAPASSSAFHQSNAFPVRLPAEGLTVRLKWSPTTPLGMLEADETPLSLTLVGADGKTVAHRTVQDLATGPRTLEIQVDAATLEAHERPGWSAAPWTANVDLRGGQVTYDLTAAVRYTDGELPSVEHTPPPPPDPLPPRTPHDPIVIPSNDAFTAENGVVSGSGTPQDPYLISGWEIQGTNGIGIALGSDGGTAPGLGTDAHVVIRNVRVHDAADFCVLLDSAQHVRVEQSTFDGCDWSLYAAGDTQDLEVLDNRFEKNDRAVALYGVQDARIVGNEIVESFSGGIVASQGATQHSANVVSSGIEIEGNTLRGSNSKITVATPGATGVDVLSNRLGDGAYIDLATGTVGNTVAGTTWLDGRPDIRQRVLSADPSQGIPTNTIVDAGSDRVLGQDGEVCFEDARIDEGPGRVVDLIVWDFGDGEVIEGERAPCHTYDDRTQAYEARLVVTFQEPPDGRVSLTDTVQVAP